MTRPYKTSGYHLMVAQNYLRNISLDGTHNDTALRMFNQPGLPDGLFKFRVRYGLPHPSENKQVTFHNPTDNESLLLPNADERSENPSINLRPESGQLSHTNTSVSLAADSSFNSASETLSSANPPGTLLPPLHERSSLSAEPQPSTSLIDDAGARLSPAGKGKAKHRRWSVSYKQSSRETLSTKGMLYKLGRWFSAVPSTSSVAKKQTDLDSSFGNMSVTSVTSKGDLRLVTSLKNMSSSSSKKERICLLTPDSHLPLIVASFLRYGQTAVHPIRYHQGAHSSSARCRHNSTSSSEAGGLKPIEIEDGKEVSYQHLLVPFRIHPLRTATTGGALSPDEAEALFSHSWNAASVRAAESPAFTLADTCFSFDEMHPRQSSEESAHIQLAQTYGAGDRWVPAYDPNVLADSDLEIGAHKTTLTFPAYLTSILSYVNADELKREINERFAHKFPHIQHLTFSKFKSLKREMAVIIRSEAPTDLLTLSQAYVYFEKIVLRGLIFKSNRKMVAGAALLLAAKLNDFRGNQLDSFLEKTETTFRINRKELLSFELPVAVALDFNLIVPDWELYPHFQRLQMAS